MYKAVYFYCCVLFDVGNVICEHYRLLEDPWTVYCLISLRLALEQSVIKTETICH